MTNPQPIFSLSGEKLKAFPLRSETTSMPTLTTFFQHSIGLAKKFVQIFPLDVTKTQADFLANPIYWKSWPQEPVEKNKKSKLERK